MRTGLWVSGAGGSGVLIARKEDGSWSPPSGIMLHTAALGFLVGVDIYDCVVVINNRKALEAFTKVRATLGGEISAVAGPVGVGGVLEHDGKWKQLNRPIFTYMKSRGFYAGVQIDGTVVIERTDENARFYGQKIGVADILAGKVRHPPYEIKMLMETVKAAEGRSDVDQSLMEELADQPAPGDVGIESPTRKPDVGPMFGLPEPDDPDPFGVLALQAAGFEIKEAGTGSRPSSSQFEFRPSPTSPIYAHFRQRSIDTIGTGSNRTSYTSHRRQMSVDRATQTSEMGTQTEPDESLTPGTSPSLWNDRDNIIEEEPVKEPEEIDYTKIDLGPYNDLNHSDPEFHSTGTTATENSHDTWSDVRHNHTSTESDMDDHYHTDGDGEADDEEDEPVVFEVAAVQTTGVSVLRPVHVVKTRGSLVDIPKRIPPPLPPRNPTRARRTADLDSGSSLTPSPTKDGFEDVDINGPTRVASMHEVLAATDLKEDRAQEEKPSKDAGADSDSSINGTRRKSTETLVDEVPKEEAYNLEKLDTPRPKHIETEDSDTFHSIPTTPQ